MNTPPPTPASTADPDAARWFEDHVHVHHSALKSYLHQSFPNARHEVDDVVQESYLRILKARAGQPLASAKAFLFRVARNIMLDFLRRSHVSPIKLVGDLGLLYVLGDRPGVAESVNMDEKVRLLVQCVATLPPRCRKVMMLRKFKSLSQREVAAQLGISEKTVDEHLRRGLKRLGASLRKRGVYSYYDP